MANYFKDNDDLRWYVERGIDWAPLVELVEAEFGHPEGHDSTAEAVAFYREILELVGGFAADEVAPAAAEMDREGVSIEDGEVRMPAAAEALFKQLSQMGLHGLVAPRSLGGMNCPMLVYMLNGELFARADVSFMTHLSFCGGMAAAMMFFSITEGSARVDPATGDLLSCRFEEEITEIIAGKAWGSMDLTEPDAGSDLAALRTRAVQDAEGRWFVTGEKVFITSGHGKYHFVLARTEPEAEGDDPLAGLEGLSLFLVRAFEGRGKKRKTYVTFERVEHKLGHHGSPTVAVNFQDSPAELLGARGDGFRQMLLLMNNARLGVGFEALGLCEAAHRLARDYAAERRSMGKTIDRHELIAEYLDDMASDIEGLRALAVTGTWHEELAQRYKLARDFSDHDEVAIQRYDRLHRRHKAKARWLTPLVKYFGAERAVDMARQCLQIHGGVGYTTEYGAEKLLRDSLVFPIYEGTSQIQALMAMKDTLGGILKNPQRFVRRVAQARWRSLSARDPLERRVSKVQSISLAVQQHLIQRTAADKIRGLSGVPVTRWADSFLRQWDPKRDFAYARLHCERLIQLLSDEAICTVLWEQTQVDPARRAVLERYLERAEPRARALQDRIVNSSDRLLEGLAAREEAEAATR